MSGKSDAATDATASGAAGGPIFETEAAMLHHLVETMGMPQAMIDTLTTQQKAAMFAMSQSRAILTQAHERIDHEEGWKHCHDTDDDDDGNDYDYEWKNTRDDVFMKIQHNLVITESTVGRRIVCQIDKDHLRIWSVRSDFEGNFGDTNAVVFVDRPLFQSVKVDESTWKVVPQDDGHAMIVISLRKAQSPMRWLAPYR